MRIFEITFLFAKYESRFHNSKHIENINFSKSLDPTFITTLGIKTKLQNLNDCKCYKMLCA